MSYGKSKKKPKKYIYYVGISDETHDDIVEEIARREQLDYDEEVYDY